MGSSSSAQPTSGLSALEKKLSEMAHQAIDGFETFLNTIKNNHGVNTSGVETSLGQAQTFVEETRKAFKDAVQTFGKEDRPAASTEVASNEEKATAATAGPGVEGTAVQETPSQPVTTS